MNMLDSGSFFLHTKKQTLPGGFIEWLAYPVNFFQRSLEKSKKCLVRSKIRCQAKHKYSVKIMSSLMSITMYY